MAYDKTHLCGATIINQNWLLSAAHCFPHSRGLNVKTLWRAVIGLREIDKPDRWTVTRKIEKIIAHENFLNGRNDVAVLKVDDPIVYGDYIRPACLPTPGKFRNEKWAHCHVTGWGLMEENGRLSRVLQEAAVQLIPLETCQQSDWYDHNVDDKMICAGFAGGGIDACQGDSGGPLSCKQKGGEDFYVVGIVSWGEGCAQRFKPGVYTSTSAYGEWIMERTGMHTAQVISAPDQGESVAVVESQTSSFVTEAAPVHQFATSEPVSMVHRNSPGQTAPLLNLLIVLYHFCISCYS
ncbi:transmembrane protease serine 9-like [Leucoraja erinacea]|uniref:transmembrane protease serine 9-like n=1 Tax=Leucoraja erinaceus TaxID=7782 RepID=UPI0024540F0D|nr:transmembrane protease serine 9-like [Leucoraja erinacea]